MTRDETETFKKAMQEWRLKYPNAVGGDFEGQSVADDISSLLKWSASEIDRLRNSMMFACDLLAERKYGHEARSPSHNARLALEAGIAGRSPAYSE